MAAEIAVASALGRTSKNLKYAKRIVESGQRSPDQLSELACAVATVEAISGNSRGARRLLQVGLDDPSENAIAQAAWLDRHKLLRIGSDNWESVLLRSPEAKAWSAFVDSRWQSSVRSCQDWLDDQPFSSRPAILGSYIASVVQCDYERSLQFAQTGLAASPTDFILLNNVAFSHAQRGNAVDAQVVFSHIDEQGLSKAERVAWLATKGLIQFRLQDAVGGRAYYNEAVELATRMGEQLRLCLAWYFWAMEELRTRSSDARQIGTTALRVCKGSAIREVVVLLERLRVALAQGST